ncbi:prostasin-like [Paramacrobiotus metropolitanus]|uniref:prostasin-like n=1 Tax=Paramacrobiotus metropolitanus TaxID=2943436 RepID=UPI0024455EA7|nr:prostasin-like [Paramacrobiotus metropolitanus]
MSWLDLFCICYIAARISAVLVGPCGEPCKSLLPSDTVEIIQLNDQYSAHFASPGFPNREAKFVARYYSVQSQPDLMGLRGLRFRSTLFDVGQTIGTHPYCSESDSVIIFDAHYLNILPRFALGIFCGNQTLDVVTYSANAVLLYRTTGKSRSLGFNITVTRACGLRNFECPSERRMCISYNHICDGVKDCPYGEDEICTMKCGVPPIPSSEVEAPVRIVGGTESDPHTWPWQAHVSVWYSGRDIGSKSTCGGTVIGPQWILTAAHCCAETDKTARPPMHVLEAEDMEVTLGIHNLDQKNKENTYQVKTILVHPRYNPMENFQCDYCLLLLDRTIQFSNKIQPICLPRYPDPVPGVKCYATGFGKTQQRSAKDESKKDPTSRVPLQVDLDLMQTQDCCQRKGSSGESMESLTPDMACANSGNVSNKDTCSGDSGGPLSCRVPNSIPLQWQLFGATSWGYGCASGTPGVYARVRTALAFVADVLYDFKREGWFSDTTVPEINWETVQQPAVSEYELIIKKTKEIYVNRSAPQGLLINLLTYGVAISVLSFFANNHC